MGRIIATTFLAALLTLGLVGSATAAAMADDSGWSIASFVSDVHVDGSGTLTVAETIDVDFSQPKHGIERDFGLEEGPGGSAIEIDSMSATDAGGASVPVDQQSTWPVAAYRIGDPGTTVTGHRTYHLAYTVKGMVGSVASGEERVDWPVTGTRWPVGMASVKATFEAPAGSLDGATCEVGPKGAEGTCPAQHDTSSATFQSSSALPSGQGLRAVATLAQGAVAISNPAPVPTSNPQTFSTTQGSGTGMAWIVLAAGGGIFFSLVFLLTRFSRRRWGSGRSSTSSSTWTDTGGGGWSDSGSGGGGSSGGDGGGSSGGGDSGGGSW